MNWDAIGAVGQVLGSIAVFVTLGYLALQVKHARSEARRAVSQGRGEALRELLGWYGSERLAKIRVKAQRTLNEEPTGYISSLMEQADLTWEEAVEMAVFQYAYWEFRKQTIPWAQELSESERRGFDRAMKHAYGPEGGIDRMFYELHKPTAHPDAVRYIDNLLAQPG